MLLHEEQTAKLRAMFPDWDIWWTQKTTLQSRDESWFSWHAKPHGALMAVLHDDNPNHLAVKILAYTDNLPEHIAAAERRIDQTPADLANLHAALERELQALRDLLSPKPEKSCKS